MIPNSDLNYVIGGGTISDVGADGTCCLSTYTTVPTSSHTPFSSVGPKDTADPSGWLYTLVGWDRTEPTLELAPNEISSLWAPQTIDLNIGYTGCRHTYCSYSGYTWVGGPSTLNSQAYLLTTTTTTLAAAPSPKSSTTAGAESLSSSTVAPTKKATSEPITQSQVSTPQPAETPRASTATTPRPAETPQESRATTSQPVETPQESEATASQPAESPQESRAGTQLGSTSSTPENIAVGGVTLQPATSASSVLVVGSQTVAPGSSVTIGSGSSTTVVALITTGSRTIVRVGTTESTLSEQVTADAISSNSPVVFGGVTASPTASGAFLVNSQTLAPGSSIIVGSGTSTTVVALETSGSQTILQVGTSKSTLSEQPTPGIAANTQPIKLEGITASPVPSGGYVVDGQTLTPGETLTLGSGSSTTAVILQTSGSDTILQIGTQVTTLTGQYGTATTDIGGYVASGLGGDGQSSSDETPRPNSSNGAIGTSAATSTGIAQSNSASRKASMLTFPVLMWLARAVFRI